MDLELEPSVDVIHRGSSSIVLVTCEHGSERFPVPWKLPAADSWLEGTHWTHDLGTRDLAAELCEAFATVGILANFSRLLADPNRPIDSPDLFRSSAEGKGIALNSDIGALERSKRLALWETYHRIMDREVERSPAKVLLSVHTFTPRYEGTTREMEIGVLFDEEEALAAHAAAMLSSAGFRVAMNAPYSGKDGLMYSVDRHARRHGRRALELEVRQDLAVVASARRRVVGAALAALSPNP